MISPKNFLYLLLGYFLPCNECVLLYEMIRDEA